MQLAHRADKEQSCRDVSPIAIEHIAGDKKKRSLAFDCLADKRFHRAAPGICKSLGNRFVFEAESRQWAIDMEISCMDKGERHEYRLSV